MPSAVTPVLGERGLPASGTAAASRPAVASAAATPASAAVATRAARFLHGQVPAVKLCTVQSANRGGGFLVRAHLHESETTGAAGIPIRHHLG